MSYARAIAAAALSFALTVPVLGAEYMEKTERQKQRAYSPGVITEGGRIVWLAGQTGLRDEDGKDNSGNFEAQARTAFRQVSLSPVGRSAVLVIARRETSQAIVTITAATSRPVQLRFPAMPAPAEALMALDRTRPGYLDDVHGNRPWREAMTRRAVAEVTTELAG